MENKKDLLKTGIFGVMKDGNNFVIVEDRIIYQSGGYDLVNQVQSNIEKLATACGFNNLKYCIKGGHNIIYDCNKDESVEMTIAEIEAKLGIKNLKIKKEGE